MLAVAGLLLLVQCGAEPTTHNRADQTPPASVGHVLVYHDSLRSVLLVNAGLGARSSPPVTTPTAIWRRTGSHWTKVDSAGPPIRNLGGVAYDIARNALVLYGGSYDLTHEYGDTWEWRPDAGWRQASVSGPGIRSHIDMVYDAEGKRVVLFGGQIGIDSFPADTWTWDGNQWTQVATQGPLPRVHHTMLYDPVAKQVVLFGGYAAWAGRDLGDTWKWNGQAWAQVAPDITSRTHARMGRTPAGKIILIGGMGAGGTGQTVMSLESGGWQSTTQPGAPLPRYLPALVFDPARGATVLFGGGDPNSDRLYDDTWEYDGQGWRLIRP